MSAERELQLVELVAPDGTATGTATVAQAHTEPGLLHRAFSVLLVDPAGRTLLQRRARSKTRFPLRWANSCCGHPAPGEAPVVAATRRLAEELGVHGVLMHAVGVYPYAAPDPATGRIEREYDHVLVGRVDVGLTIRPDPAEIDATRWMPTTEVLDDITARSSDGYAPWLEGVLTVALRPPLGFPGRKSLS
jgi:isopentenyl-diphosphate delta-isomerase